MTSTTHRRLGRQAFAKCPDCTSLTSLHVGGTNLPKTLTKYSERGQAYVDSLHSLMKMNRLQPTDDAYLGDGPTILLIPAGEGVN
jgi:hypothetical protein